MNSAVAIILRTELRAWRNRLTSNSGRALGLAILIALGCLFIGVTLFGVAFAAGSVLPSARESILTGVFTALSVMMLVVGFPSVIGSYFAGRDLIQLVLAPVPVKQIFVARSLFAMSANTLVGVLFLTFIVGFGAGSGASPIYYLLALLLVVLQVLLLTALQVNVMAAVLRWVPARLARDVAVGVAGISGAVLYAIWNLTIRQTFTTFHRQPNFSQLESALHRIDWLPSAWPGHALFAAITGDVAGTLLWTALVLLVSGVLTASAALLYESTLLSGLGLLGGVGVARRRSALGPVIATREGVGSPGVAIARKDWIVYRRDIRRLMRFLPALLFVFVYGFVLRPTRGIDPLWNGAFVIAFISFFLSLLFATTSIPSERRGFQLLRLAPITTWELLRAKVLFALAPVLVASLVPALGIAVLSGEGAVGSLALAVLAVWVGLGCVCIGVSAGAIDPQFESTDDRRSVGVIGTFLAMGAQLAFALLSIGAFGLLFLASQFAEGMRPLPFLPVAPALAAPAAVAALLLLTGAASLVTLLLSTAASHLRSFEGAIATT